MTARVCRTLVVIAVLLVSGWLAWRPQPLFAGWSRPAECGCGLDYNGGWACWGPLRCFRNDPDPHASAELVVAYGGGGLQITFSAYYDSQSFWCSILDSEQAQLAATAAAGISPDDYLYIWSDGVLRDDQYTCWDLSVYHSSASL